MNEPGKETSYPGTDYRDVDSKKRPEVKYEDGKCTGCGRETKGINYCQHCGSKLKHPDDEEPVEA